MKVKELKQEQLDNLKMTIGVEKYNDTSLDVLYYISNEEVYEYFKNIEFSEDDFEL